MYTIWLVMCEAGTWRNKSIFLIFDLRIAEILCMFILKKKRHFAELTGFGVAHKNAEVFS